MDKFERQLRAAAAAVGIDPDNPMVTGPHLVAGDTEAIARALLDDKPCSPELRSLYGKFVERTVIELGKKHGIVA